MQHVRLGNTGLRVSRICLGTMTFGLQVDEAASGAILDHAAELGVTFLDTADVYSIMDRIESAGRELREHIKHIHSVDYNPVEVYMPGIRVSLPR